MRQVSLRYGAVVAAVFLGWLAREALAPSIGPTALPFITFFPAVAVAAWYGGLGPGLLAIALAALTADWFFVDPRHSFRIADPVGFLGFPIAAGLILAAFEAMHRASRELSRTRDTLATTLKSIGDGVIVTDARGNVTFLNREAERLTGWTNAEAQGRRLAEVFRIVNELTRAESENPVEKVLRLGTVVGLANHTVLIHRDGSETPVDDSAAPVSEPGQPIAGVVLVFRDVRGQRQADAARARLAAIVESSGDAIVSKSVDGTVTTWNDAAENLFGYRRDEIVGRSILTIIPPEHRDEEERIVAALRNGRGSELIETVRLTKDGRRIPVSVRVSPLRNGHGEIIGASKTVRDLSDLVEARNALTRERDLLSTTLASIGDGVIITNAAGEVTFLNPVAEHLTGWTQGNAAGRPLTEVFRIVNETTRAEAENPALRAMRENAIVGLANHTVLLDRAGGERAIDDSAAPIRDRQGRVIGSVLVFRDVTQRRQADAVLQRAEEHSRSVVNNVVDGIIAIDDSARIRSFNRAAELLFGYSASEVIGQNVKMLMPEPYQSEHDGYVDNYLKTGTARIIGIGREVVGLRKDGSTFPMELAVSEFSVANEKYFTGIVRDLTERNQRDAALREGEARFRVALEGTPVAVFNCDRDLRFTWLYNSRPPIDATRAIGKRIDEFLPPESTRELVEVLQRVVVTGTGERRVVAIPHGDDVLYFDSAVEPMRDDRGDITGVRGALADISERRRIDLERERMARALREADERKNEFLATLAHELRNPLAPIANSITLLQLKGPSTPELVEARGVIERQVRQMSHLLDDLLDVNRLDRRKFELRRQPVPLTSIIQSALETARPGIERGRHRVSVDVPDDIIVDGDLLRLSQVFANLLNNAAKYTDDDGEITIKATRDADFVVVSVKDSGIGIPAESMPRLFETFSQAPSTMERARGGIGIGLSLAKGLVELHGGTIAAESEGVGKGSVFTVRLPIVAGAPASTSVVGEPPPRTSAPTRRILIADDVRDNADTLAMLLRALDHTVEVAYDGSQAVAVAERFRPEVGVFDIAMPLMNGLEACRHIRQQSWGKSIYMIAQTGWGQREDRARAAEAGFDRHMLKPVDVSALLALIATLPGRFDSTT